MKKYKLKRAMSVALCGSIMIGFAGCSKDAQNLLNLYNYAKDEVVSYASDIKDKFDSFATENSSDNVETKEDVSEETTSVEETTAQTTTQEVKEYYDKDSVGYVNTNVNLRESDSKESEIIDEIDRYQKIEFIESNDTYDYICYDGNYGYVLSKYTGDLTDTYVEVDISDQNVSLYKDNDLIVSDKVVSGRKDIHDTRLGCHYIYSKQTNRYLKGSDFNVYVNYWMPFDKGIGLHDASWRSEFGGDIYKTNGSHGCVNMKLDTAKTIYENVEANKTKVLVHK